MIEPESNSDIYALTTIGGKTNRYMLNLGTVGWDNKSSRPCPKVARGVKTVCLIWRVKRPPSFILLFDGAGCPFS